MVDVYTHDNRISWNATWRTWHAKASDLGWLLGPVQITDPQTGSGRRYDFQYPQIDEGGEIIAWWFASEDGTKLKLLRA